MNTCCRVTTEAELWINCRVCFNDPLLPARSGPHFATLVIQNAFLKNSGNSVPVLTWQTSWEDATVRQRRRVGTSDAGRFTTSSSEFNTYIIDRNWFWNVMKVSELVIVKWRITLWLVTWWWWIIAHAQGPHKKKCIGSRPSRGICRSDFLLTLARRFYERDHKLVMDKFHLEVIREVWSLRHPAGLRRSCRSCYDASQSVTSFYDDLSCFMRSMWKMWEPGES